MIDVASVAINSLWILSLATLLGLYSWASWQARRQGLRLRDVWMRPALQRYVGISLLLFCASLAVLSYRWWERVLWAVLALYQAAQQVSAWRAQRRSVRSHGPAD